MAALRCQSTQQQLNGICPKVAEIIARAYAEQAPTEYRRGWEAAKEASARTAEEAHKVINFVGPTSIIGSGIAERIRKLEAPHE
jgi:hypothetical protein